jgi:hypothetical protein
VIGRALIWTNILIASSAAGWVVVTLRALALPMDCSLIALGFVLALVFYTRDRLDEKEYVTDLATMPERTAWVQRHSPLLKRVIWVGSFGAISLLTLRPAAVLPLLTGFGFALTYTVRWLPWQGRRVGWKHLPGMKTPLVAVLWVLVVVITPAAAYGRAWQRDTWLLACAACTLIMVQILVNDLRDIDGDRTSGTLSLPVVLGEPAARRVGLVLALIGALLPLSMLPLPFLLAGLYSAFIVLRYRRERDSEWRGWIEGQGLVAGLAALIYAARS